MSDSVDPLPEYPPSINQEDLYSVIEKRLREIGLVEEADYYIAVYDGAADLVIEEIPGGTAGAIDAVAASKKELHDLGWFAATVRPLDNPRIQLEPYMGRRAERLPETLYHATSASRLPSIMEHGLMPHQGGGTYLKRSYPPRIYLSRNRADAIAFVNGMTEHGTPISDPVLLAIKTFDLPVESSFYVDEMSGLMKYVDLPHGVWTYQPIPVSAIQQKIFKIPEPEQSSAPIFR